MCRPGTIPLREDPRDAFVSGRYANLADMPPGARVGSSSLRRQAQIREAFPGIKVDWLRGNVNTRLAKLDAGEFDAIILAVSGLQRLGMQDRITAALPPELCLPAIGQGALGIEVRADDETLKTMLAPLAHAASTTRIAAERALNHTLNGGCQVPIAGYAELDHDEIHLRGLVGEPDGSRILRAEIRGAGTQAHDLGVRLAKELIAMGADQILEKLRH